MNRAQALAILELPREQAVNLIVALGEKAEHWDVLQARGAANTPISPTTPSGMTPVYLKPRARRRRKKPGQKPGHPGVCRAAPQHIDDALEHELKTCPKCGTAVGQPIREHTRFIEDIPKVTPLVTAHTIHGYWCCQCKTIVTPKVTAALPRSRLGLHLVVYSAWLHYLVGVSVGNCVKIAAVSLGFQVSPGGLTLAWKNLATLLESQYDAIGRTIRQSAVLHAEETGWRINGVTCWLWAFARRLIKRLRRHRRELFTFLDHEGVSPYNNHAEQQMRTAVHTRKVSQQNRSLQGGQNSRHLPHLVPLGSASGTSPRPIRDATRPSRPRQQIH